jgi:hypothetical protein
MRPIELTKSDYEYLSVEKYMALTEQEKNKIQSVKIIPPSLDGDNFGKIQVKYKVPTYKVYGIN